MPGQTTNTFSTYDGGRNREVLSDMISMITPDETPLYSLIGTKKVEGVFPQWNLDALRTPSVTNYQIEGDVYEFNAITPTSKVGNYTQIFRESFLVSRTQEAVSKAGPKSEFNREKMKAGINVRRDVEVTIALNQASVAGDDSTPRRLAGLRAWLATNDSIGSGGSSGGYNAGIVAAATNGTQRSLTKALMDDNIQTVYQAGGDCSVFMVSPYLKRVFSSFMSDSNVAAFRTNLSGKDQGTIYGAADMYISDFGNISVVPNRQWGIIGATLTRNAFLIDASKLHVGVLRGISDDNRIAPTGDHEPGVMLGEMTLLVDNEKALGVIADLFGSTAST